MKSSSKGIYSSLKDSAVAWDERLRLARHAWDSADCVIPNKQQVLFDWIIQEIISGYKKGVKGFNSQLLNGLWELLLRTLQSQELSSPGKLPVTLKPQFLQVFIDVFLCKDPTYSEISISTIISCCYTIMSTPHLTASVLAKFESYVSFLSALVSFYAQISLEESKELHLLLEICLQKYLFVQRQQANQRKVFTSMCQQLLGPLVKLRHMLKGSSEICQPMLQCRDQQDNWQSGNTQDIWYLVELAVTRCLFHKDHMAEYPQAFMVREEKQTDTDEPVNKKPRIFSYPKLLLDKMWEMTDTVTREDIVGTRKAALEILPFLYKEFFNSNRKLKSSTSAVEFAFFTEICQMMGILNGKCVHITPSIFALLHQLLECILQRDIYQVSDDSLNGSVQFSWFKNLVEVTIKAHEPGEPVFKCLDVLLKLNHSLLEPHLDVIWAMLWKAECNAGVACNCLMTSLISTYVKLRQFEKLVLAILVSLRKLDISGFRLTPFFNQRSTKAIQSLPLGQITTIWDIFCDEIIENYLSKVSSSSEAALGNKPRKKTSSPQLPVTVWKNLEYVISIFSPFLLNMSFVGIGEHLKGKTSLSSIGKLLRRTVLDVLHPLIEKSKEQHETLKESACFSILLLQYALGELELFLKKFQIVDVDDETTKILSSVVWIDEMSDFVPAKTNKEMIPILCKDKGRLCFLKSALCIQNIRSVLLNENKTAEQDAEGNELKRLVSSVCSIVSDVPWCSASWDRQEWSINEENAPVALWDLIGRHAVVLLPLCTADQQLQMANLLIRTITQETQEAGQTQPGCITMFDVSMELIQSAGFHEMLAMQSSTVCAFWGRLKQAIDASKCANSPGNRMMKVLSDIATPGFSNIGILTETSHEDTTIDDDQDDDTEMDSDSDQNAEESSDEDNQDNEDDKEKETHQSGKQRVDNLQTFRSLGCDIAGMSSGVLLSETPATNMLASAGKIEQLLKVLGHLPLDWLSDENHIRCLIGLFTCDVILASNIFQDCSPDLLKPLSLTRHLLTVLFDGCITRRKFVAHNVLGFESLHSWLIGSTTRLWRNNHTNPTCVSDTNAMLRDTRGLLVSTFKYLLRAPSQTAPAVQTKIQTLRDELQTFSSEVQDDSQDSLKKSLTSHHAVLVVVEGILALCEEVVSSKTSSSKMIRITSDVVIKLGPGLLELLRGILQKSQRKQRKNVQDVGKSTLHNILCQWPVLVDSFTSLLHIYSVSEQSRKFIHVKEVYKRCEWQEVFDITLTAVIHYVFERDQVQSLFPVNKNEVRTLHSCLRFLKVVCLSYLELHLPKDFHVRLLASTLHFLRTLELNKKTSADHPKNDGLLHDKTNGCHESEMIEQTITEKAKCSDSEDIVEEGYSLVVSLLEGCDPGLLPELLEGLGDEITTKNIGGASVERLSVALRVWRRLLSGQFTKDRRKELRPKLPKVLLALQFVLQELKTDYLMVVNLAVDVMVKILSLGKGMVLPHNATLVLHSGLVKLSANNSRSFPQMFESQYSLLSTLLFQHSEAVYGAVHVFITCVRNLLLSLIQSFDDQNKAAAEQHESRTSGKTLKPSDTVNSAQRMARLYQEISSHKIAFSKYSPYMIADYIHGIQTVAIPSVIRDALVPGVYCLLELCGEHELSLLHAVLDKGSRELFHSLHADYTKYHKFKGKV